MNWYKRLIHADSIVIQRGSDQSNVNYHLNPDPGMLKDIAAEGGREMKLRFMNTPNGWAVWPSRQATHFEMAEALGITETRAHTEESGIGEIKGNKVFYLWYEGSTPLPWPVVDSKSLWTHQLQLPDQYEAETPDDFDLQRQDAQQSFEMMDQPTSSFYSRWGD